MSEVRPLHVLIKAVLLYALANIAFAYFNPSVGKLSIYNTWVPGRERVPYEREVAYYNISHTIMVYKDMDAMYQSTTLSEPKQADEYRIFLIGDSSAWGFQLHPEQTLVGRLNSMDLKSCDGRSVVLYSAAFPLPYVMKDLLIIDKMHEYDPDMFLWTITLDGFRNRGIFTSYFLDPHVGKVHELVDQYQLTNLDIEKMQEQTFWDRTIIGQRDRLKRIFLLQIHGLGWSATRLDYDYHKYAPLLQDQSPDTLFFEMQEDELDLDQILFDVLDAGYKHAEPFPVLVINQPIFIASGANSDVRYNELYPRWAYDEYREYLDQWMQAKGRSYLDAWDLLPASEFTDTPFHRTPAGEEIFAEYLAPQIQNLSCTK